MSHDAHDIEHDNTDTGGGPDGQAGYYESTDYGLPYISPWSRIVDDPMTSRLLRHMNCSYMGAPGHPPTLLALKQHAQSLAVLISYLEPTISSGRIDGYGQGDHNPEGRLVGGDGRAGQHNASTYVDRPDRRLDHGGAFDWLASLSIPYHNDDPNHHRPLNALMNEVHSRSDVNDTQFWCPLTRVQPRKPQDAADAELADGFAAAVATTAFASHSNLVRHANECLERLDHEFSATGGIMSLIPPDGAGLGADEFAAARNTLLGQMLMHMQAMYLRMHEFEHDVGNMRDALAGDAVAPMQALTAGGPDATATGRELVVAQDRYVLVNAGDATWRQLHGEFDKHEALLDARQRVHREGGLSGQRQWMEGAGGDQHVRGIVPLDVRTRLYRLTGHGHSTIFISPAFGHVEGSAGTRLNEQERGLISLVQPRWPERVSEWERQYNERIAAADEARRDASQARREKDDLAGQVDHLRHELEAREHARNAAVTVLAAVQAAGAGAGGDDDEAKRAASERYIGELMNQLGAFRASYLELDASLRGAEAQLVEAHRSARVAETAAKANEHQHYHHIADALGRAVDAMTKAGIADPEVTTLLGDAIARAVQQEQANLVAAPAAGGPGTAETDLARARGR